MIFAADRSTLTQGQARLPRGGRAYFVMPKQPTELAFPVKGFDENWAYKNQPEGTSPDCLNVRAYDVIQKRLRGGQRAGLSKVFASPVNDPYAIQRMGLIQLATQSTPGSSTLDTFTQADGPVDPVNWAGYSRFTPGVYIPSLTVPEVAGNQIVLTQTNSDTAGVAALHQIQRSSAGVFTLSAKISWAVTNTNQAFFAGFAWGSSGPDSVVGWHFAGISHSGFSPSVYNLIAGGSVLLTVAITPGSNDYHDPAWWATLRTVAFTWTPDPAFADNYIMSVKIDGVDIPLLNTTAFGRSTLGPSVGFVLEADSSIGNTVTLGLDDWGLDIPAVTTHRLPHVVVVSGGAIYSGSLTAGLVASDNPTGNLVISPDATFQAAFGKVYFCDGTSTGYKILDLLTNTVTDWEAAVEAAGAGLVPPVVTKLPQDGLLGCRIIALYRGRIVLAGLSTDPQNWFMSAAGIPAVGVEGPLDWNYNPNPFVETQAVAGNNSVVGLVGDLITCLAPISDDLMVMGGDHTLWIMSGDPAAGGRIDNISQQVGISGPDAYAVDPFGVFYFFGNGVLWKMEKGSLPEPISRGRLDKTFGNIDLATTSVKLLWDDANHGLHIFFQPLSNTTATHYFWDARVDGFFPQQFPTVYGPACVLLYDGDQPTDRALWLGGFDSYIRKLDTTRNDDDGFAIQSRIRFGPMNAGQVWANSRISKIVTKLDADSDPVTFRVHAGNTPQEAATTSAIAFGKTLTPLNPYATPRITGNSLAVEVRNDAFSAAWVTATDYAVGDTVLGPDGFPYSCLIAHTSDVFADDLAAADWVLDDFRTWACEGMAVLMDACGRTRHGRL